MRNLLLTMLHLAVIAAKICGPGGVRAVIVESKVLAGKHRRALDSTVLDDAVARQDTITLLVTQIRRVRKLPPARGGLHRSTLQDLGVTKLS